MSDTARPQTPSGSHIAYFDTIRGLAALSVIGSHYVLAFGLPCKSELWTQLWTFTPLHMWWDGFAAVSLFFVLSGFVLSLRHFRSSQQPDLVKFSLKSYFISRFCRIWLPYIAVLLISAVLRKSLVLDYNILALPPTSWFHGLWQEPLTVKSLINEGLLFSPSRSVIVPHGWTLSIELILSFIIPIGILLAARSTYWLIFFTLFAIHQLRLSEFQFHFMLGILMAKYYREIQQKVGANRNFRLLLVVGGILLYNARYTIPGIFSLFGGFNLNEKLAWFLTGVGAALLLSFAMGSLRTQSFLSLPWLRAMGKISYSIYLLHMMVLICVTPLVLRLFNPTPSFGLLAWCAGLFATMATTIIFAAFSYRLLEIPSIALGKNLSRKFTPRVDE